MVVPSLPLHCRDLVLFRQIALTLRPNVLRGCLHRDVVWWWSFHSWWCLRFCLEQCEADDWKILHQLFPVPRGRWVCLHAELLVQQQRRICPDNYNYSGADEGKIHLQLLTVPRRLVRCDVVWW